MLFRSGNIYLYLSNFNIGSFPKIKNYISSGFLTTEQSISILGDILKIDGTTTIDKISFNKEALLKSEKLDNIKKEIFREVINLTEANYHSLTISNNFSNNIEVVIIKTSLPEEMRKVLINNRKIFINFLENQLKIKYDEHIKE